MSFDERGSAIIGASALSRRCRFFYEGALTENTAPLIAERTMFR